MIIEVMPMIVLMINGLIVAVIVYVICRLIKMQTNRRNTNQEGLKAEIRGLRAEIFEQQNKEYETQLEILQLNKDKTNALRHDMNNHLMVLKQLASKGELEEAEKYIDEILEGICNPEEFLATGNNALDSIINLKLTMAKEKLNANIKVEVFIEKNIGVDKSDLITIFGNLLDNALEAIEKCADNRYIHLKIKEDRGILFGTLENSYVGELMGKEKSFSSTKEDKELHGYGLRNVVRTLEKYDGELIFVTEEKAEGNNFCAKVVMYM